MLDLAAHFSFFLKRLPMAPGPTLNFRGEGGEAIRSSLKLSIDHGCLYVDSKMTPDCDLHVFFGKPVALSVPTRGRQKERHMQAYPSARGQK